jgi:pilus assembly protein Flp/PilA
MKTLLRNVLARVGRNRSGATAIEYGLIAGFIALGVIVAVGQLGTTTNDSFVAVQDGFN